MEGYPLGAIPVDKPDDQGHHGTQEAREQVDEDGEAGKDRPGSLVPRAHAGRRGHARTRPAASRPSGLGLDSVVSSLLGQGKPPDLFWTYLLYLRCSVPEVSLVAVLNPSYLVVPPSLVGVSSGWVLARVIR